MRNCPAPYKLAWGPMGPAHEGYAPMSTSVPNSAWFVQAAGERNL